MRGPSAYHLFPPALALLFALAFLPAAASAQDATAMPPPADTAQADTMPADTVQTDTAQVDTTQEVGAAREAGQAWLAHIDASNYERSWQAAAQMFKDQVTPEQWTQAGQQVRAQTGALESRTFAGGEYTTSLPGAPQGEAYVVLTYDAQFADANGQETLVMVREVSAWKAAGYRVQPAPGQQ